VQHPSGPRNEVKLNFHVLHHGHAAKAGRGGGRKSSAASMSLAKRPVTCNVPALQDAYATGPEANELRQTIHAKVNPAQVPFGTWGALANGASTDGRPFCNGRPLVAPSLPDIASTPHMYISSLSRFVSRCSPALQRMVSRRALGAVPVEGRPLPPEPPPPPPVPTPAPAPAPPRLPAPGVKPSLPILGLQAGGAAAAGGVRGIIPGAVPQPLQAQGQAAAPAAGNTAALEYLKQALSVLGKVRFGRRWEGGREGGKVCGGR
jgi:hypothetical protein